MSAIVGYLTSVNAQASDLVGEYQSGILVKRSKGFNAVLFGLMARLANESSDNTEFNLFERDPVTRRVFSSAGTTVTTATTLAFDDGAGNSAHVFLGLGDTLWNQRSGEYVYVAENPTTGNVVVQRAINSVSGTVVDNDEWVIVSRGIEEGGNASRGEYENPSLITNYIQTFSRTYELSLQFKGEVLRSDAEGKQRDAALQALERISADIELAYLFGVKTKITGGTSKRLYTTGGIHDAIVKAGLSSTNILNGNGTSGISIDALISWTKNVLTNGSDAKLLLAGPSAYSAISSYANSGAAGYRYTSTDRAWGLQIQTINTPFGEIGLAMHPLLKETPNLHDKAILVDLENVIQKVKVPLIFRDCLADNDAFAIKEGFYAELGLKLSFPEAFGSLTNFSKVIA